MAGAAAPNASRDAAKIARCMKSSPTAHPVARALSRPRVATEHIPYYYVRILAGVYAKRPNRQISWRFLLVMLAKSIPVSGEMLPAIGIGTYKGFDLPDGEETRKRLAEVLRRLFAAGGVIVDSSPMYGRAEARAGQALASL